MRRIEWMRLLPLGAAAGLGILVVQLWPEEPARAGWLAWLNLFLLGLLIVLLVQYGIRLLLRMGEPAPGSKLRARLVIAMVGMLLVPAVALQMAASQMVERGMDVWFDVRVDTLLDRALNLAQGFYDRVEKELKQSMLPYLSDPILLKAAGGRPDYPVLHAHLSDIVAHEGWDSAELFDLNERLIAAVKGGGIAAFRASPLSETARLSMRLGRMATELVADAEGEKAVGYAPLVGATAVAGLLRVEVHLPEGMIRNARAVEADYRKYRDLERNRQAIRVMFTHAMLLVTMIIVIVAGLAGLMFARRLTAPIGRLADALGRISEGELDVQLKETGDDELGMLVRAFNRMTARLRDNARAIAQAQQDLTEALASSRQRQYVLETLLANLHSGVLLVEDSGRIRLINQAARNILRLGDAWMPGADFTGLARGYLRGVGAFFEELLHLDEGQLQREIEVELPRRRTVHVLMRGARLHARGERGFSGFLLVVDDVTDLIEAQRSRAWAEVARRLAHEIKNPLTPIKLAAERLERRFRKQVSDHETFDACTSAIITQVERLQRLIADFTTLARLPKPRFAETDAAEVMREMARLFAPYGRVDVRVPERKVSCWMDADQVRQVLINLVDNALAATESTEGRVRVWLEAGDSELKLFVEDDGPGLDAEEAEAIFEPYYSTKPSGSGLGLAIAQRIAEDHHGTLSLDSPRNPTRFALRLPRDPRSMEEA